MKKINIGICGWGNVATGLYKAINKNHELIKKLNIKHEECYNLLLNQGYQILKIDGTNSLEDICNEILRYINN